MEKFRVKINDPNNIIRLKNREIRTPCETVVDSAELKLLLVSLASYGCSSYSVKKIKGFSDDEEYDSSIFIQKVPNLKEAIFTPTKDDNNSILAKVYDEILPSPNKKSKAPVLTRRREKEEVFIITQTREKEAKKNKPVSTKPREVHIPDSLRRDLIAPHSTALREPMLESGSVRRVIESSKRIYNNIKPEELEQEKLFLNSIDNFDPKDILKNDVEVRIEELQIESSSILKRVLKEIEQ